MCELFGFSAARRYEINEYLKTFYSHSPNHPDGWGLVCFEGSEAFIEKEPMQASKSRYLKNRLTLPIDNQNVFAHIRYATIGNVEYSNCHPYTGKDSTGRRWTFIHNGTIFDYGKLNKYCAIQSGDTDSERILLYILDEINENVKKKGQALEPKERFLLLDGIISDMSKGNKLNLLLYDGEYTYVHTNYRDSLYYLKGEERIIFSTQPLSDEDWKPVDFTTLLVYRNGEKVFSGTNHGNEYQENAENIKFLYQAFSNL
jgi:glutamine amidotransferase